MDSQQEKEILVELIAGSDAAFDKIYKLYSLRLFGNLIKLVKSRPLAEEIMQDVFFRLWKYRKSIDPEKSFRSFLFKIAENKVYDYFRIASRDKKMMAEISYLSTANYHLLAEFKTDDTKSAILQQAIEALSPQRKQIFRLCKLDGKSYKEVSELLGISVSTISDHIVKGTKSIREYIESHEKTFLGIIILALAVL